MEAEKKSNVALIKNFFESGKHGRKVELSELKALTKESREELGELIELEEKDAA